MSTVLARRLVVPGLAATLALGAASVAGADEILLKNGGRISGVIVERTADRVVVEAGPGRVTLPMSRVDRIVEGHSALAAYRERAAATAPTDARGWADLARWAEDRGLITQAQDAWQRVLDLEPGHPQANAALGRMQVDGKWMAADDARRAQGYVQYEGRWATPPEFEALLREREAEDAERRERRETQARVREAEARAAEAEARAREAEAAAGQPYDDGSIPYWWWGYGGGGAVVPPIGQWPDRPSVRPPPPSRPPAESRPPSTIGAGSKPSKPSQAGGVGPAPAPKPNPKP